MKITVERDALNAALSACVRGIERGTTIPICSHFLVETDADRVTFRATNLDMEVNASVAAEVDRPGVETLLGSSIQAFVAKGKGSTVTIVWEDGQARATCGRTAITVPTLQAADFPTLEPGEFTSEFTMPAVDIKTCVEQVIGFVADGESRAHLAGIFLHRNDDGEPDALRFAASNGSAFALSSCARPTGAEALHAVIVPTRAMEEAARVGKGDCSVSASGRIVRFAFDGLTITTKVIEGSFVDYRQMSTVSVGPLTTFDASALMEAVDRCEIADDKGRAVKLTINGDVLTVERRGTDKGHVRDEVEVASESADEILTGVNAAYLMAALRSLGPDDVTLGIARHGSNALILRRPGQEVPVVGIAPMAPR